MSKVTGERIECPVCNNSYMKYDGDHVTRCIEEYGMCCSCFGRCPYCEPGELTDEEVDKILNVIEPVPIPPELEKRVKKIIQQYGNKNCV